MKQPRTDTIPKIKSGQESKIGALHELQERHRLGYQGPLMDILLSPSAPKRKEFVEDNKEVGITMLDLSEVPQSVSDYKLLKLIANLLDPTAEESRQGGYYNKYILEDSGAGQEIKPAKVFLSTFALKKIEKRVADALADIRHNKGFSERHIRLIQGIFPHDEEGHLRFDSKDDLIRFIRKTPIYEAYNASLITDHEKTTLVYIICSLLKSLRRKADMINDRDSINTARIALERFMKLDFIAGFQIHPLPGEQLYTTDLSSARYFDDKIFSITEESLERLGIDFSHEIHFKIFWRAKSDESIENKCMIEPETTATTIVNDLGAATIILQNPDPKETKKEAMILLYYMFRIFADNAQKYNPMIYKSFGNNTQLNGFSSKGYYAHNKDKAVTFLNELTVAGTYNDQKPVVKDNGGVLGTPKRQHDFNDFFKEFKHMGIDDVRFETLIDHLITVNQNKEAKKQADIAKQKNAQKLAVFTPLCTGKVPQENIQALFNAITDEKTIIGKKDKQETFTYNYKSQEYTFNTALYKDLLETFKQQWKTRETKNLLDIAQSRPESHKGKFDTAKICALLWTGIQESLAMETQIMPSNNITSMDDIDVHEIYNASKGLNIRARDNSGILSENDIEKIVEVYALDLFNRKPDALCQKGITLRQLQNNIEKDDALMPAGGTLKEKLAYNFKHARSVRKANGTLFIAKYFDNLFAHGLVPPSLAHYAKPPKSSNGNGNGNGNSNGKS